MAGRGRSPVDGLFDAFAEGLGDAVDRGMDGLFRELKKGARKAIQDTLRPGPATKAPLKGPPTTPTRTLKRATPMRIRRPKTWTQMCNWLAGLGLGNRYYQEDGPTTITNVQAVTVHAVGADGQPRDLQLVLDPEWRNPWANDDGTGPRLK